MAPTSRRRRAFEERAGKRKARNIAAAVFGMLAIGIIVYAIIVARSRPVSRIYLHFHQIQTTTTVGANTANRFNDATKFRMEEIPFQSEATNKLAKFFKAYDLRTNQPIPDLVEPIKSSSEGWGDLPREFDETDILMIYSNGHIVSKSQLPRGSIQNDEDQVFWLGPEQGNDINPIGLKQHLNTLDTLDATVVLFLDAGQYSWSPLHPTRQPSDFHDELAKLVEQLEHPDLWVVVSHSKNEISLTSTPLQDSIFALSIKQAIKKLDNESTNVVKLFKEIWKTTTSCSRNFRNNSMQHPVLMKSGMGWFQENQFAQDQEIEKFRFDSRDPTQADEDNSDEKKLTTYNLEDFGQPNITFTESNTDADANSTTFEYYESFERSPVQMMFQVQKFLGLGKLILVPDEDIIPLEDAKSKAIGRYRRNIYDLSLRLKFVSFMMIWGDIVNGRLSGKLERFKTAKDLFWNNSDEVDSTRFHYSNDSIETSNQFTAVSEWNKEYVGFRTKVEDFYEIVENTSKKSAEEGDGPISLTPYEAEIIGVVRNRIMPMINREVAVSELKYVLDVADWSEVGSFDSQKQQSVNPRYEAAAKFYFDITNFEDWQRNNDLNSNDMLARINLAIRGSEGMSELTAVIPKVKPRQREISITACENNTCRAFWGHNFYKCQIDNANFAKLKVDLVSKFEPAAYGLSEIPRLRSDENWPPKQISITAQREHNFIDFYFYVYCAPGTGERELKFQLSDASKTVDISIPIQPEYPLELHSHRDLGVESGNHKSSQARLLPWPGLPRNNHQLIGHSLKLNTIANMKSGFVFAIGNKTESPVAGMTVKLYSLDQTVLKNKFRSDRLPLVDQIENHLHKVWENRRAHLSLVGSYELPVLAALESTPRFSFSAPASEGEEKEEQPNALDIAIAGGLLLTLEDEFANPMWFQILEFNPQPPFDNAAQIEKLQTSRELRFGKFLEKHFPSPNEISRDETYKGIESSIVSPAAAEIVFNTISNAHQSREIKFELGRAYSDERFPIPSNVAEPYILMIDALGIPNYACFKVDSDIIENNSRIRDRTKKLAGIRVKSDYWEPYQNGFVYDSLFSNATGSDREQMVYLRSRSPVEGNPPKEITVEFSLPFDQYFSPVTSKNDFEYTVNSDTRKFLPFPTKRRHFVDATNFHFWTEISRHTTNPLTLDIDSNTIIEIFSNNERIGRWKITSANPNTAENPVTGNPMEYLELALTKRKEGDIDSTELKFSVAKLLPSVALENCQLRIDEAILPMDRIGKFKKGNDYTVSLGKLQNIYRKELDWSSRKVKLEQGENVNLDIELLATDFFGRIHKRTVSTVFKGKRQRKKAKPAEPKDDGSSKG